MKKNFLIIVVVLFFSTGLSAQKDKKSEKLSPEQSKQLLDQLSIDTAKLLAEFSTNACHCIDSIPLLKKGTKEISEDISKCIDAQTGAYQLSMKLMGSLKSGNTNNKIELNIDKNSGDYKQYYYQIERWLRDSCKALSNAIASNNKESANSYSADPAALAAYNAGIEWLKKGDFEKALPAFELAVKTDPDFAFAWDNLGVCNRKLGKLDAALKAYQKSLELDPKGVTPLHNIPVVYEFQKEYDKALEAYQNILRIYPDDPEAYYGEGRIYAYFKPDMEKALQNMCKAYTIYSSTNSPYRVDAEKNISYIYGKMKADGKENRFFEILKENNISTGN